MRGRLTRWRLLAGLLTGALRRAGDDLVAWPSRGEWPAAVLAAYLARLPLRGANPGLLAHIPCYCRCAASGHRSNLDCYVKSDNGASLLLDPHGLGCDTCAARTLEAQDLTGRGLSDCAVRQAIDAHWSGTGHATNTLLLS